MLKVLLYISIIIIFNISFLIDIFKFIFLVKLKFYNNFTTNDFINF